MKYIFISPHLDDAILSCGGWIYELLNEGNKVAICTVFSGLPNEVSELAKEFFEVKDVPEARAYVMNRWLEDDNAMKVLGVREYIRMTFLDAPFREGEFKEASDKLALSIALRILQYLKPNIDKTLVVPLGIGKHIDHLICKRASLMLEFEIPILFYADFPYAQNNKKEWGKISEMLTPYQISVSEKSFEKWQLAVSEYKSQISSLFTRGISLYDFWRSCENKSIFYPKA